jgi:FkbM family methyltransferase
VGAHDPVELSITKYFYDLGWRGLNLEAAPGFANKIRNGRPRDTTLNVGVSDHEGSLTFFEASSKESGLSTLSAEEAEIHRRAGRKFKEYEIPVKTLSALCAEHVKEPIDFMSVDVEGHESQVLEGADFTVFRPKVLVVEATRPLSQEPTHQNWEHILNRADYLFAVFDGVNRYYVASEHRDLAESLVLPPNPFDDFVPYYYQSRIDALRKELSYYRAPRMVADGIGRLVKGAASLLARPFAGKSD